MSKVMPILPSDVIDKKIDLFPAEVIEAFNELIAENFEGSSSKITRSQAINRISQKMPQIISEDGTANIERNWLNVEDIYRKAGWQVTYDNPGYNETYEGSYLFKKK